METKNLLLPAKYNSEGREISCHDPTFKLWCMTFNVQSKLNLDCMVPEKYDHIIWMRDWLYNKKSSSDYYSH